MPKLAVARVYIVVRHGLEDYISTAFADHNKRQNPGAIAL